MKKIILFLCMILLVLASCDKKEIPDKGKLNPDAMILIKPAPGVRSTVSGLTALEIVKQGDQIKYQSRYFDNRYNEEEIYTPRRMFSDAQRDLTIPALKMFGIDVINQRGEYIRDFTYATDVVITNSDNDTIAYVPDKVINEARLKIEAAYKDENYTEVYRIFNEAFTFLPFPTKE